MIGEDYFWRLTYVFVFFLLPYVTVTNLVLYVATAFDPDLISFGIVLFRTVETITGQGKIRLAIGL